MINGIDGLEFSFDISLDDILYVFVIELCRFLRLIYVANIRIQGINVFQFIVFEEEFLSGTVNFNNRGFCVGRCYFFGILDIGVCQLFLFVKIFFFILVFYFYLGDLLFYKEIGGFFLNKEVYGIFLNVELYIGISVKSSKRL